MANKKTDKTGGVETLLVELLTEELPPKALRSFGDAFAKALAEDLRQDDLLEAGSDVRALTTPRRLAVQITKVRERAPDRPVELSGPSVKVALDASGTPTQALIGFAKKYGVETAALVRRETPKGEFFFYQGIARGSHLDANLAVKVSAALERLPILKLMRWGSGDDRFVRPVHGLVMLHGSRSRIVQGVVLGAESSNKTLGHRFLSGGEISLEHAEDYESVLRDKGKVIVDFAERRADISKQLEKVAAGAELVVNDALLDEVTAIVEAPSVYEGTFSPEFLALPEECLTLSMQQHQKYVPLRDRATRKLLPRFLFVSNIPAKDPDEIIRGNERVLRARLSDAKFFYDQDRKTRLEARVQRLARVVYHNKLGSQLDRTQRIKSLAGRIASTLGVDALLVGRAAELSKADLLTDMVGEFPELQGIMGRYYALHDNESPEVASAIDQHYRPRFAGDRLPDNRIANVVALADKLEAIVGMFGIGQIPTGDKDPFALRRHALGVIRILIENKIEIGILPLIDLARGEMPQNATSDWLPVVEFLLDRARSYFSDQGFAPQAVESVLQPFGSRSPLYTLREIVAEASSFMATDEGRILATANKRITNILKKSNFEVPFGLLPEQLIQKPRPDLFRDKAEVEFWNALTEIGGESLSLKKQNRFAESLRVLSKLGAPTKSFFDEVMVNTNEPEIQSNRITLVQHARAYMNQVADLSLMAS